MLQGRANVKDQEQDQEVAQQFMRLFCALMQVVHLRAAVKAGQWRNLEQAKPEGRHT